MQSTAADAVSLFLNATPDRPSQGGEALDRLGQALLPAGSQGLTYAKVMADASLSRTEFLGLLGTATSTGLVEAFDDGGERKLRLTATGKSLY